MTNREQTVAATADIGAERVLLLVRAALLLLIVLVIGVTVVRGYGMMLAMRDLTSSSGDYGGWLAIARAGVEGGTIYRDAWTSKPPVVFFYLMPFVALFSPDPLALNLATVVAVTAFIIVMTLLAHRLSGSRSAAAAAGLLAAFYGVWQDGPETTFLMATFGAAAVLVTVTARGRALPYLVAGALFTLGVFTKQPLAVELPVLLAFAIWSSSQTRPRGHRARWWRPPLLVGIGCALALAGLLGWALSRDVLALMWDRAFSQNVQYVAGGDAAWHFQAEFIGAVQTYFIPETLPYLLPLLVLAVPALWLRLRQRPLPWLTLIVLAWLLLAFGGALVGRALKPDYFTQTLPPLLIVIALGVTAVQRTRPMTQVGLAALALLVVGQFASGPVTANYQRHKAQTAREDAIVAIVQAETTPEDCIWTWGPIGYFSYMADRDLCASPVNEGFLMDATAFPITRNRIAYMNELIDSRPALLITRRGWGFFDELQRYADRYVSEQIHQHSIYTVYRVDTSAQHTTYADFGGEIALVGYDLPPRAAYCPGDPLDLALTWRLLRQPGVQYLFFAQVLTPDHDARLAGHDGIPSSDRPTNEWAHPGEILLGDPFTITLPPDIAPGTYPLVVGLYEVVSNERRPVRDAAGQAVGTYTTLHMIDVDGDC